ncbi:HNH endonuclease [Pseudomonas sp.]|uniref:HNH endonuclease n=1 Tax=Pseudomonas sp. TaxID=306 RepID=UPI003D6E770A
MSKGDRLFRGLESHAAEKLSRDALAPFLNDRGYVVIADKRIQTGVATQQFISIRTPDGQVLSMRVRLCWRRDGRNPNEKKYAAAQLAAHLRQGGWDATLEHITSRDTKRGLTHNLLVQRDEGAIIFAALIPIESLHAIWNRQREVSDDLQRRELKGRAKKNHAQNGTSPTLWLQDDRTPDGHEVADALWQWPGVIDLAKLTPHTRESELVDDTYDDCPAPDYSSLGRDEGERVPVLRSEVRRDPHVRRAVLERAGFACEREDCGKRRDFPGFLDVHHILGAEKSDRVYNCVALCPCCHREAHYAPYADDLNKQLLTYAKRFG